MATTSSPAPTSVRDQKDRPAKTDGDSGRRDTKARTDDERPRAAWLSSPANLLATLVRSAAWIVAAIIAVGILLVVLKANPNNGIVSAVRAIAHDLVGPFTGMFNVDPPRAGIAANWGTGAAVYVVAGLIVAWLISKIGTVGSRRRGGAPPERRSETTSGPSTKT